MYNILSNHKTTSKFYYDVFLSTFNKIFEEKILYVFPMSVSDTALIYDMIKWR